MQISTVHELAHALRRADSLLRIVGWKLYDVQVDADTGFVRIYAEARDRGEGRQILIHRSSARDRVIVERSRVFRREGMYTSTWEIADTLGRDCFDGPGALAEAAKFMLHYACDNTARDAVSGRMSEARHAMVERFFASLPPAREQTLGASYSLVPVPLTEEWIRDCERTCCRGDGWDSYPGLVRAGGSSHLLTWVRASGVIVDGRGVHREGSVDYGPTGARPRA